MNDEIKEINIKIPGQILDYVDTKEHLLDLFNYITNLQQEIEKLNDDKRGMLVQLYKANDDRDKVKQENERLKKALNCKEYFSSTMPEDTEFVILTKNNYDRQQKDIQFELIDYKSRCEKAIDLLNKRKNEVNEDLWVEMRASDYFEECDEIINILQNGADEK